MSTVLSRVLVTKSHVVLQHDGLQQEEADAVAALLAAASGLSSEDMNASTPYPSGLCLAYTWSSTGNSAGPADVPYIAVITTCSCHLICYGLNVQAVLFIRCTE